MAYGGVLIVRKFCECLGGCVQETHVLQSNANRRDSLSSKFMAYLMINREVKSCKEVSLLTQDL